MKNIIKKIRTDLKASVDEKTKGNFQRFFKEEVRYYGVKSGTVEKIAKKHWPEIKAASKKDAESRQ